jgi:DNA-directed RNA polymerase specialized sigma24 family protein
MEEFGGSYEMADRLESEEVFDGLIGFAGERNRDSLRLRFGGDYLIDEIAEKDGVSWDCARDRVRRGLAKIKSELEEERS